MSDIITDKNKMVKGWTGGLPETPCGAGSMIKNTVFQREWIPEIVEKYKIKSIADIGAGDLNWILGLELPVNTKYKAYDLVPRNEAIIKFDITKQVPKKVDLIMCLWVLNHLTDEDNNNAIKNMYDSGSKYLMVTERPSQPKRHYPITFEYVEYLKLNEKGDCIKLIEL